MFKRCDKNILCENLCETFFRKLGKSCGITLFLEIEFCAITPIASDIKDGVKLEGSDFESAGRPFESGRAYQIKDRYKAKGI